MSTERRRITLIGGPYHERTFDPEKLDLFGTKYRLKLPVDANCQPTDNPDSVIRAIYSPIVMDRPDFILFHFQKYEKLDRSQFSVEFADGPLAGTRQMKQPIEGLGPIVGVPMKSEPFEGDGRVRVWAFYKQSNRNDKRLYFDKIERRVVKDARLILEFLGGPMDGWTLDSDDAANAPEHFHAAMFYWLVKEGSEGKRFYTFPSQHRHEAFEDFGDAAEQFGGPYTLPLYEVIERLEESFEVYLRARYIHEESLGLSLAKKK
jgi:hypothetical protein